MKNQFVIHQLIDYLIQQGMLADDAFVLQQQLAGQRVDDLSAAVSRLQDLATKVSQGYIKPEEMASLGSMLNRSLMEQAVSGNPDLQEAFDVMEIQGA